jgi:hypothetical protein
MKILTKIDNRIPIYKGFKARAPLTVLLILLIFTGTLGYWYGAYKNERVAHAQTVIVLSEVQEMKHKQQSELDQALAELEAYKAEHPDPTREEIEAYVRMIFRKDANVALAVSHHECGYTHRDYPKCSLKSSVEHSIGLFQINLYNSQKNVHADRIPGKTMGEKIQWLENPFNNTLYSYWLFTHSGFNPWTAYSKGYYLNDPLMGGKK